MPACFTNGHSIWEGVAHTCRPNEEKVIYFLLLTRKERQPSVEDEARASVGDHQQLGEWIQL